MVGCWSLGNVLISPLDGTDSEKLKVSARIFVCFEPSRGNCELMLGKLYFNISKVSGSPEASRLNIKIFRYILFGSFETFSADFGSKVYMYHYCITTHFGISLSLLISWNCSITFIIFCYFCTSEISLRNETIYFYLIFFCREKQQITIMNALIATRNLFSHQCWKFTLNHTQKTRISCARSAETNISINKAWNLTVPLYIPKDLEDTL